MNKYISKEKYTEVVDNIELSMSVIFSEKAAAKKMVDMVLVELDISVCDHPEPIPGGVGRNAIGRSAICGICGTYLSDTTMICEKFPTSACTMHEMHCQSPNCYVVIENV
jgi:hypothetical protein